MFNHDMLTLARESRGLTQSALSRRAGISQGRISKLEVGLIPASHSTVAMLAAALELPTEFFHQVDSVYGPGISEFFHRKNSVSSRILSQLHANLNLRRIHIDRLLASAELNAENIPQLDPDEHGGSPKLVAQTVRAIWQLPAGPVKNLTRAVEDAGGIVALLDFGTPKIQGVSRWVPGMPPMFFLNEQMPGDRQRLTLAHELGHVVMHRIPTPEGEREAFEFAAEFLMPESEVSPYLDRVTLQSLAALKPYWKVSIAALLYRATELRCISPRQQRSLWMSMGKLGYRRKEPPELDIPIEQPTILQELISLHREQLSYSVDDLAALLRLEPKEIQTLYGVSDAPTGGRPNLRILADTN